MISTLLMSLFSIFFDLVAILRTSKSDKDLEILIFRQQVRILQRKTKTPPRIFDPERMVLATLPDKNCSFKDVARQHLHQVMLIFKPEPVLRWHRELVRRKWTFMLAHIIGSLRDFLLWIQEENRNGPIRRRNILGGIIHDTQSKDSLLHRLIPMVRFFTPYKLVQ
jgi:hypothetical protein